MLSLSRILRISRPRFWMYLLGTYLLGVTAANPDLTPLTTIRLILFAIYFTLPANLMVYGVNDICDYDTDRLNPKKLEYEALVLPSERKSLLTTIGFLSLPFAAALIWSVPKTALAFIAAFILLSVYYSLPPIRAKARPIIDSLFNILYAMPGFFGFALAGGKSPSLSIFTACVCWTMAMHAFSAVPDIESDREAGLATIATLLGHPGTISVCIILYTTSALLAIHVLGLVAIQLLCIYVVLLGIAYVGSSANVMRVYRVFPLVNTLSGFILFLTVFFSKRA